MKLREFLSEKNFCVYKITNVINGKIYVGKTNNIEKRWRDHLRLAKNNETNSYLYSSINKYGSENFKIEIIEKNLSENDAFEKEKFWIKNLNSRDLNIGMNLTIGGEGVAGLKWTEESINKIQGSNNHNYGKNISQLMKEQNPNIFSGKNNGFCNKKHSEVTIYFLKNREISEEQKIKSSEGTRGSKHPRSKLNEEMVLEIRKLAASGMSQKEISLIFNVKRHTINQIINRKRWTHI